MAKQLKGMPKFKSALKAERGNLIIGSRRGVKRVAEAVRDQAAVNAPELTGALKRGQEIRYREGGQYAEVGAFDPRLYYHVFVHDGTSSVEANPYLRNAADAVLPKAEGFIARDIDQATGR